MPSYLSLFLWYVAETFGSPLLSHFGGRMVFLPILMSLGSSSGSLFRFNLGCLGILLYFGWVASILLLLQIGDNIDKANFVQFITVFADPGVDGMLLQGTFKRFSHSVSAQTWIKCFHICRPNVYRGSLLSVPRFLVWRTFHLRRSALYWRISWHNSSQGLLLQTFPLIGFRIKFKNAVMGEGADVLSRLQQVYRHVFDIKVQQTLQG